MATGTRCSGCSLVHSVRMKIDVVRMSVSAEKNCDRDPFGADLESESGCG